jgi:hypothetical protein
VNDITKCLNWREIVLTSDKQILVYVLILLDLIRLAHSHMDPPDSRACPLFVTVRKTELLSPALFFLSCIVARVDNIKEFQTSQQTLE